MQNNLTNLHSIFKLNGKKAPYVQPRIITRTDDELLEAIGPAMATTGGPIGGLTGDEDDLFE